MNTDFVIDLSELSSCSSSSSPRQLVDCNLCFEAVPTLMSTSCGHSCCAECMVDFLKGLFFLSLFLLGLTIKHSDFHRPEQVELLWLFCSAHGRGGHFVVACLRPWRFDGEFRGSVPRQTHGLDGGQGGVLLSRLPRSDDWRMLADSVLELPLRLFLLSVVLEAGEQSFKAQVQVHAKVSAVQDDGGEERGAVSKMGGRARGSQRSAARVPQVQVSDSED